MSVSEVQDDAPTAAVLVIGNEILSGRTQDANLGWLAGRLVDLGIRLREARVVSDVEAEIVDAVRALSARYTYVFTTGGIGPTHDDITADSIAKAFDVPIDRDPEAVRRMEQRYGVGKVNEVSLRMARIPQGAALIDNIVSAAPGFRIGNVFVMAGVPAIMRAMFDGVAPTLTGGAKMLQRIVTCGLAESMLANPLAHIQSRYPTTEIGSYPFYRRGGFGVSLVARGTDAAILDHVEAEIVAAIKDLGGELISPNAA